ncbi:MAG: AAA family ATPase, partial [Anaerolineae bacterium]|nr:AAA family ATPase [Anaerolineae bacterium]NIN99521.1 AAA family ATPase [Anaerolineae bacterium]NIQ82382.1 AAA family ATPase [Anaerolineae bacterium]
MPTLRLYFLGSLDIRYDGQQLPKPPTLKSQSLLAYLILHRDQPQPRDRLVDLFWGDRPEAKARRSLRTALWHIRRGLPDEALILSDRRTVQFDTRADLWLDVDEFEFLVGADDIADLQSAVALYRGDFMDGFYDDWVINERYRLETLFSEALTRLMVAQEGREEYDGALATAARLLGHDPLREDAHRLAMRAYCRLGQRNAALEQYRRCRETILEELGTEPMVETTELYQEILERRFPAVGVAKAVPIQVPSLQPTPAAGRDPLDVAAPARLIGREQELAFLQRCWQEAEARQGGLVFISGEAGVGKTRLAEEFAHRLRWQGVRVLWGRCYEFERVLPYQPVTEALESTLPALSSSELAGFPAWIVTEVARLVPDVLEKRPDLDVTPAVPSDEERTRLFDAMSRFLAELSSNAPLLVVMEDLQWASESTLQLVHYLARHLAGHQILMVGTFRPEAIGLQDPLMGLRRRLTQEGVADSLRLSRLSPEAVTEMVVEMSGAGEAVGPLAGRLYQETEGNPFFLMEMVKAFFEEDMICLEEGAWKGDFAEISDGELPLPASVSQAIEARASHLDEQAEEAIRLAAVLGREFDFDVLSSVWGQGEETTLQALDNLLRRRLIQEGTGPTSRDYAFSHHKIQEVVYAGLPRRHRRYAHAQVGAAMERLWASQGEEVAGELAFHFLEGMQSDEKLTEKAIDYLLRAGDYARLAYADQEAIGYYQQALRLLRQQRQNERAARTLMKLGLTYHTSLHFRQARDAYEAGFTLWQQAGTVQPASLLPAPHALRVVQTEPVTVDPSKVADWLSGAVIEQLFSPLVRISPEMDVLPEAARSWEVLEGGRKYVFHLRDGARWSDGRPVTAADFEYGWKRMLSPATEPSLASSFSDIKGARDFHQGVVSDPSGVGVRSVDELKLVVELEEPAGHFLHLAAYATAVPRHKVEAHADEWTEVGKIVTNGPFELEAWQRGKSMVLVRNPQYHGRFGGNLQRVELFFFKEYSAALESYDADRLDILPLQGLPRAEMDRILQRHAGEYVPIPDLATYYVRFDLRRPPFSDRRV